MGHVLTCEGLQSDPDKVSAILNMERPKTITEIKSFCGAIGYLARFAPGLSGILRPIRDLTKSDTAFKWGPNQESAFEEAKKLIIKSLVLGYYDANKPLPLQTDASSYGIGACLMQDGRPIYYASQTLSDAQQKWGHIDKELYSVLFGLERFHYFTYGREVTVQNDHKPLQTIVRKPLGKAPKRLQAMMLRILAYNVNLQYHPGKQITLADLLSRIPLADDTVTIRKPSKLEHVDATSILPIRPDKLDEIRETTASDSSLQELQRVIRYGWNSLEETNPSLTPYKSYLDELSFQNGLILKGDQVVIPKSLRRKYLDIVHSAHGGIQACMREARKCIFWPHMAAEIKQYVKTCDVC